MSERRSQRSQPRWQAIAWRCVAIATVLALLVLGFAWYAHSVGVPEFIARLLRTALAQSGAKLQWERLRLQGVRTLVAENVRLARSSDGVETEIAIAQMTVRVSSGSVWTLQPQPESLSISGARLDLQSIGSNTAPARLVVDNIAAQLAAHGNDRWELTRLDGRLGNLEIAITASITNASALRDRLQARPSKPKDPRARERWHSIIASLNQTRFDQGSSIRLRVSGDAAASNSFEAVLDARIPGAATPWGHASALTLTGTAAPGKAKLGAVETDLAVQCGQWRGDLGEGEQLSGSLHWNGAASTWQLRFAETQLSAARIKFAKMELHHAKAAARTSPTNGLASLNTTFDLRSARTEATWGAMAELHATGGLAHAGLALSSISGQCDLTAAQLRSDRGVIGSARASLQVAPRTHTSQTQQTELASTAWRHIDRFDVRWTAELTELDSPKLKIERATVAGQWKSPMVLLSDFSAELYRGRLKGGGQLDVVTRELRSSAELDFDVRQIAPLLTTNAQRWLRQFSWETPPKVTVQGRLVLPSWTNREPKWNRDVAPTIELSGAFVGSNGAFRKVPVTSAQSHFTLTNLCWQLPDLTVLRPEGAARLAYRGDMRTQEFSWDVTGSINPSAFRPLLDPPQQKALDYFAFDLPPHFQGQIWGRWHDRGRLGFRGTVAATNFTFRGENCSAFTGTLAYTNLLLNFKNVAVSRGEQRITVPQGLFDLRAELLCVSNAWSTMDPQLVTKVVGPKVHAALQPYQFARPPQVRIDGCLPMSRGAEARVHFSVSGQEFTYWKFHIPQISGELDWKGDTLSVSNVIAEFYSGQLVGDGFFDFRAKKGADLQFRAQVTGADLQRLAADLMPNTKHLEGTLNGNLVVVEANSNDDSSWHGYGDVNLRDGFLWNIPIFGFLSPFLNKVAPGLGSSRASAGSATFLIDDSVIHTSDLEVRSPALRMQYVGSVDFDGRVNARMQAEVLRDAWAVGRFVSLVLWPISKVFEYKVTGTLHEPVSEPLYIPKALTWPFRPFHALRNLLPDGKPPENPQNEKKP